MSFSVHETTFPCDANGCQDVVACHHDSTNVGSQKFFQNCCSRRLKLVLENDKTNKVEVTFDFASGHLLSLDPTKLLEMTAGNTNDTITFVSIP